MKLHMMKAVLLLSLSQLSFAELPQKPNSCPSVSALQSVEISDLVKEQGFWYGIVNSNNYDTTDKWTFAIGAFKASNKDKAKQQTVDAMNALTFESGPEPFSVFDQDSWFCLYNDASGHKAFAITPTLSFFHSWLIPH